jgi:hypothetical protein
MRNAIVQKKPLSVIKIQIKTAGKKWLNPQGTGDELSGQKSGHGFQKV